MSRMVVEASINNGPWLIAELHVEQERIDVTSAVARKPDPAWQHTDAAGHFHAWSLNGYEPTLPTIRVRVERVGSEDEGYTIDHHECDLCGEEMTPGTVPDWGPKSVPGRRSWRVKVEGAPMDLPHELVSIRVRHERAPEVFGFAHPTERYAEGGSDGTRTWVLFEGNGELGVRQGGKANVRGDAA